MLTTDPYKIHIIDHKPNKSTCGPLSEPCANGSYRVRRHKRSNTFPPIAALAASACMHGSGHLRRAASAAFGMPLLSPAWWPAPWRSPPSSSVCGGAGSRARGCASCTPFRPPLPVPLQPPPSPLWPPPSPLRPPPTCRSSPQLGDHFCPPLPFFFYWELIWGTTGVGNRKKIAGMCSRRPQYVADTCAAGYNIGSAVELEVVLRSRCLGSSVQAF
jgi:hypothetical protein